MLVSVQEISRSAHTKKESYPDDNLDNLSRISLTQPILINGKRKYEFHPHLKSVHHTVTYPSTMKESF